MIVYATALPSGYRTRPAAEADRDAFVQLSATTLGPYARRVFGLDDAVIRSGLTAEFDPAGTTVVVHDEFGCVSFVVVQERKDEFWLDHMVVEPSHQGRGIGTAVVRAVQAAAGDRGRCVGLSVVDGNPARALYERLGFEVQRVEPPRTFMRWTSHGLERSPAVRLRTLDLDHDLDAAVRWYADPTVLHLSEGAGTTAYDEGTIRRMYAHLGAGGDVFAVEVEVNGAWTAVGDAVLRRDTLPIVVGDPLYRSLGVGTAVLSELVARARAKGWAELRVRRVFADNVRSLNMYRSAGFVETGRSCDDGGREQVQLRLDLTGGP